MRSCAAARHDPKTSSSKQHRQQEQAAGQKAHHRHEPAAALARFDQMMCGPGPLCARTAPVAPGDSTGDDANDARDHLDPSSADGAKVVQWVRERSPQPPSLRIDGQEVVLLEKPAVTSHK